MKRIEFSKTFEKAYKKRIIPSSKWRQAYSERYRLFVSDKRGYPINDHALTGTMAGQRAWSVANDLRVIYYETDNLIIFTDIGTHAQVYR